MISSCTRRHPCRHPQLKKDPTALRPPPHAAAPSASVPPTSSPISQLHRQPPAVSDTDLATEVSCCDGLFPNPFPSRTPTTPPTPHRGRQPTMSDIEKVFTYLNDSIPQWFLDVTSIEEKIVAMLDELAKMPAPPARPLMRKSGSVESIRDLDVVMEESGQSVEGHPSPLPTRKRKSPSVVSERRPNFLKIRSRSMIVVSYDGQLQQSFEHIVRAIGTGRNLLRKGKMVAKMEAMAALAGSDDDSDDDDAVMSKMGYRSRTGLSSIRTQPTTPDTDVAKSSTTPVEVFDAVDKALENAQSLCERAAHQSLREGDCRKELETVRGHFGEVQDAAKIEVARIATKKEQEAQVAAQAAEAAQQEVTVEAVPLPAPEQKKVLPVEVAPTAHSTHIMSKVMDIEVDEDDDDDDFNFVMPPIRLTSRV